MKKIFKPLVITVFALANLLTPAFAEDMDVFKYNPASSVPPIFKEGALKIPQNFTTDHSIKVLIYPHTLKNDWRHGVPDDASRIKFQSEADIIFKSGSKQIKSKDVEFRYSTKGIVAVIGGKSQTLSNNIEFQASAKPIKVLRFNNESKSNSYFGTFELYIEDGKLNLVNTIDIENYLLGVVPSESISSWPIDALKAQALAARSYALYHLLAGKIAKRWDVDDTARFQVYTGISHRTPSTDQAVIETKGEVVTYENKVIVAFFHSYSGGFTDSAKNIFGSDTAAYCGQAEEIFTRDHLRENISKSSQWIVEWRKPWTKQKMIQDLKNRADTKELFKNFDIDGGLEFNITDLNENYDSIKEIELIQGQNIASMTFRAFRAGLSWTNFNGYHYYLEDETAQNVTIRGYGWGHHVGLSQWGAFMMSKYFGRSYKDIISHYYQNTKIKKI